MGTGKNCSYRRGAASDAIMTRAVLLACVCFFFSGCACALIGGDLQIAVCKGWLMSGFEYSLEFAEDISHAVVY